MCKGVIALVETKPILSRYALPRSASKFRHGYPVRHAKFLKDAMEDINSLTNKLEAFKDPLYAETFASAMQELIGIYYVIAEGSTPVVMQEQKIITFLHGGKCKALSCTEI